MSLQSRREYLAIAQKRYRDAKTKNERSRIINEVVENLSYHRKYAIYVLNHPLPDRRQKIRRTRKPKYLEAFPVIQVIWEALDYPCAERLHPVLLSTAENLARHGEIVLTPLIKHQLSKISRSTLARILARWQSPKRRLVRSRNSSLSRLRVEVPVRSYAWDEQRPGALEVDLVEHNGGSSLGQFAYTITVLDIVSGYSRRRAVLGRGQAGIFRELAGILREWPFWPWGLHTDNGSEFLNHHLVRFCRENGLEFTRSRPYRKNDNAHVEQKNRQFVREIVGYERYDSPKAVAWLNTLYGLLDTYVNLFLPMRKVIAKEKQGGRVIKRYDVARTPFQRLIEAGVLEPKVQSLLEQQLKTINPLALHRQIEALLSKGPHEFMAPENELQIATI